MLGQPVLERALTRQVGARRGQVALVVLLGPGTRGDQRRQSVGLGAVLDGSMRRLPVMTVTCSPLRPSILVNRCSISAVAAGEPPSLLPAVPRLAQHWVSICPPR